MTNAGGGQAVTGTAGHPRDSSTTNGTAGRPQPKPSTTDTQAKPRTTAKMKAQARAAARAAERLKLGGRLPAPDKRGKRKAPADDVEEWENVPPRPADDHVDAIVGNALPKQHSG
jgi:hypothetical protein